MDAPSPVSSRDPKCRVKGLHHSSTEGAKALSALFRMQTFLGKKRCQGFDQLFTVGLRGPIHFHTVTSLRWNVDRI